MTTMRSSLLAVLIFGACRGLDLPGMRPVDYQEGQPVKLHANKVTSTKTQLPYDYYDLKHCKAKKESHGASSLGQELIGDTVTLTPYQLMLKQNKECILLCETNYSDKDARKFRELIDDEYVVHWMVDGFPVAYRMRYGQSGEKSYLVRGFPVGFVAPMDQQMHFLFNHHRFDIEYHEDPSSFKGARIVGVEVEPFSIARKQEGGEPGQPLPQCDTAPMTSHMVHDFQAINGATKVLWTYDVVWHASDKRWAHRWEVFLLSNPNSKLHLFSLVNSIMIAVFLAGVVAMILLRMLRRDINEYNEAEDDASEHGWKLVHGDIFRAPSHYPTLSVLVGTGVQLCAVGGGTLLFALLGFLAPQNQGAAVQIGLLLFCVSGGVCGYHSSRFFKFFGGKNWRRSTLLAGLAYPCAIGFLFMVLEVMTSAEGSSAALPITTLSKVLALWLCLSLPLVFIGSYLGLRKEPFEVPVRTKLIARVVPPSSWYNSPVFTVALGGLLCFGAVCIEFFFIMTAIWHHQIYAVFGFLVAVAVILTVTCAEVAIVMCYFQLCAEDWRWWWRSFFTTGSAGVYLMAYAVWYFYWRLSIENPISTVVFFIYMTIASISFSLITGSIGVVSCFLFVRTIYGSIKID